MDFLLITLFFLHRWEGRELNDSHFEKRGPDLVKETNSHESLLTPCFLILSLIIPTLNSKKDDRVT